MIQGKGKEHLPSVLRRIVGPGHVEAGPVAGETYSYDASLISGAPEVVVFPADTAEVAAVVAAVARAGVPCTARGFGTNLSGGSVPVRGGVVVGLARMNRILAIQPERRTATVQCGVTNLELQNALTPLGFFYAPDPASQKVATLGGNAAENSGGPHCLKYGVTTNHVLGMEVVLADGEIVRFGGAALDPPGYDLRGLFIGSEGTFGIVTEVTVRLMPRPETVVTLLAVYDSVSEAARSVSAIIAAGIVPATLELMDAPVIRAVEESFACGYPLDATAVLIIEVEGPAAGLADQAEAIQRICMAHGCRTIRQARDAAERDQLWAGRRGAFGAIARIAPNYLVADGSVPRTRLPEALERVAAIARRHGFQAGNVAHAGDGNLHPLLLFDARNREHLERVHQAGREIMQVCSDLGGTITGEHGVGVEKMAAMRMLFSEDDLDFQRTLRNAIDPHGRLNPGKVLPEGEGQPIPSVAPAPETREFGCHTLSSDLSEARCAGMAGHTLLPMNRETRCGTPKASSDGLLASSGAASSVELTPATAAEAAAMVHAAAASGTALLSVGGGRRADFGNLPARGATQFAEVPPVRLRTDRLAALIEHDPPNQVVTAGAGMKLAALQELLAAHRQWLPLRPPLADGCTLGGMAALGAAGPERHRYGAPRDRLLGLQFVSGTGAVIAAGGRVVKNVAGYDITRLLAGSAGTLGLITQLTFSVLAVPEVCRAVTGRGSLARCAAAAGELLRSNIEPAFATAATDSGAGGDAWTLAVGFEGFEVTVRSQVRRCRAMLEQAGLAADREVDYPLHAGFHAGAFAELFRAPFLLRADVPADKAAEVASSVGCHAHAAVCVGLEGRPGDMPTPNSRRGHGAQLADFACGRVYAALPGLADDDWAAVCAAAAAAGGHVILENAPADFKQRHDVFGPARGEWRIMGRIKRELDPHNVFAPGRGPRGESTGATPCPPIYRGQGVPE